MDKLPVGQLPDLQQSNNDDEIMVITNSEYSQLKKEKISDFITDLTSTDENNAIVKGTDGKLFTKDFGDASNITEGTLPVSVLPDIPKDLLPAIETSDLPVSGVSADTYAYPSSVTVNAQGQVTAIEEGSPSGANANTDLSNITDAGKEVIKENSGGGLEVLDIGIAPLGINEAENKRRYLNGQLIQQSQFSSFTSKLKSRVGWNAETKTATLLPNLVKTEEQWQAAKTLSAYGQVGAFVIDDEAGTIRLPAVVNIQGVFDLQNAGLTVDAALPNVTSPEQLTGVGGTSNNNGVNTALKVRVIEVGKHGSGGSQYGQIKASLDLSRSNPIYSDDADTVQIEAIQYPYFIQVATGVEENLPAINNYEISNPFAFGMSQYYKGELNNLSWLKSNGQWNSGSVYTSFINWVISNVNSGTKDFKGVGYAYKDSSNKMYYISAVTPTSGNTVYADEGGYCFPVGTVALASDSGLTLTIGDDSVAVTRDSASDKAVTDSWWITDYDYGYNSTDNTFRLPLLDGTECLPSDKYVDVELEASASNYIAPANGWYSMQKISGGTDKYITMSNLPSVITTISHVPSAANTCSVFLPISRQQTMELVYDATGNTNYFRFIYAKGEGTLYYYVGAVAENADIINAGEFANLWTEKTSPEQAAHAAMPSDRYINLTLGASGTKYTAPADGWYYAVKNATIAGEFISVVHDIRQDVFRATNVGDSVWAFSPVYKGETVKIEYNTTGPTNYFRFIYANGAPST